MRKGEEKREGQGLKKKRLKGVKKKDKQQKNTLIPRKMTVVFSNTRGREIFE